MTSRSTGPASTPPWPATGRRCCCCTATRRAMSCGTGSLPELADGHTVVLADLRGYGDSSRPASVPDHASYSKRAMAADQVGLMRRLGFETFALVGHDRGARVAHRLCLDHPEAVSRVALLDIVPTRHVFSHVDRALSQAYYHWFFLSQPPDLPEHLIGADPELLGAPQARTVVGCRRDRCLRARGGRGVRPLLQRPGRDPGELRGLPRRRLHRPRARRGRRGSRSARGVPHARALGQPRASSAARTTSSTCGTRTPPTCEATRSTAATSCAEERPEETLTALGDFLAAHGASDR